MILKDLNIDIRSLGGNIISVFEEHGSDAFFVLSSLMTECLTLKDTKLHILSFHHVYEHYFHTCLRLGINLETQKDRILFEEFPRTFIEKTDMDYIKDGNLKQLLTHINSKQDKKWIFIDCISDLLNFTDYKQIQIFAHYLKTILNNDTTIVILSQYSQSDIEQNAIKSYLETISTQNINISPLKTGFSKDVSGSLLLKNKLQHKYFHYKITDKNVKIFIPGNL